MSTVQGVEYNHTLDNYYLNGIYIVSTIDAGGCVWIGFVLTMFFGVWLFFEIVLTIEYGDYPLIEIGQTIVSAIVYRLELIIKATDFEDHLLVGIAWAIGFECCLWIGIVQTFGTETAN